MHRRIRRSQCTRDAGRGLATARLRAPRLAHLLGGVVLAACSAIPTGPTGPTGERDALGYALEARTRPGPVNLPLRTRGGRQFWADVFWFADWRIQENVVTGHFRLLDPEDVRRAWGSRADCRAAFEDYRERLGLQQDADHLVLVLHGLWRSRASMRRIASALNEAGCAAMVVGYPSTRRSIEGHADQLVELLNELEGVERLSIVTHSLGGLVARAALSRDAPWKQQIALERMVMLAPPNQGSRFAASLSGIPGFGLIAGRAASEIAAGAPRELPTPECRLTIVAGRRGVGHGWNPFMPGEEDGVVTVEETRLEGADNYHFVNCLHGMMTRDGEVIDAVVARCTEPGLNHQ